MPDQQEVRTLTRAELDLLSGEPLPERDQPCVMGAVFASTLAATEAINAGSQSKGA